MTVLNILLPVKYNSANAYSSGGVYRKSTLRANSWPGNCVITKHLLAPRLNTSIIIFSAINISINLLYTCDLSEVIITSISPEVTAPLR